MQFVSKAHIDNLQKDAQRLGSTFTLDKLDAGCQAIQHHEYFLIASADGHLFAEGVSVTEDGDFICVMIDTMGKESVSWARQNFNQFAGADDDISVVCETLETVRKTYLAQVAQTRSEAA